GAVDKMAIVKAHIANMFVVQDARKVRAEIEDYVRKGTLSQANAFDLEDAILDKLNALAVSGPDDNDGPGNQMAYAGTPEGEGIPF
ncbi:MAG TPA: hypothetical protein VLK33_20440, partial [Terriglobales bacterium]|nr:hypothetical protein [Terriglobales bacterium]